MPNTAVAFDHITAGFIMSQLVVWEQKLDGEHSAKSAEVGHDWLMGGFWLLSEAITNVIANSGMEWDDGVFTYSHCENDEASLWLPVVDRMSEGEWSDLGGNNNLPKWLEDQVLQTMKTLGIL